MYFINSFTKGLSILLFVFSFSNCSLKKEKEEATIDPASIDYSPNFMGVFNGSDKNKSDSSISKISITVEGKNRIKIFNLGNSGDFLLGKVFKNGVTIEEDTIKIDTLKYSFKGGGFLNNDTLTLLYSKTSYLKGTTDSREFTGNR